MVGPDKKLQENIQSKLNQASYSLNSKLGDVSTDLTTNATSFSSSLLGIVSQRLIPRIKGGFVPVCEVLICNNAVANLIRENKIHEIPAVIETSAKEGMISINRAMVDLVRKKEISLKNAMDYAADPAEIRNLLR